MNPVRRKIFSLSLSITGGIKPPSLSAAISAAPESIHLGGCHFGAWTGKAFIGQPVCSPQIGHGAFRMHRRFIPIRADAFGANRRPMALLAEILFPTTGMSTPWSLPGGIPATRHNNIPASRNLNHRFSFTVCIDSPGARGFAIIPNAGVSLLNKPHTPCSLPRKRFHITSCLKFFALIKSRWHFKVS